MIIILAADCILSPIQEHKNGKAAEMDRIIHVDNQNCKYVAV